MIVKIGKEKMELKASLAAEMSWKACQNIGDELESTRDSNRGHFLESNYNEMFKFHRWVVESINKSMAQGANVLDL